MGIAVEWLLIISIVYGASGVATKYYSSKDECFDAANVAIEDMAVVSGRGWRSDFILVVCVPIKRPHH